jgi:hypothetical protein
LEQLKLDVKGRLACNISLKEADEKRAEAFGTLYAQAITKNIDERFPKEAVDVLDSFSVFNAEHLPPDTKSNMFELYGKKEIDTLQNHYFCDDQKKAQHLPNKWQDFKFELVQLRKRWFEFKESVESNKMKVKLSATEWTLHQIMQRFSSPDTDYPLLTEIVKIAIVTPVTNSWPERAASEIKRIKTRLRSRTKNDLLNGLLMLSINGPDYGSAEAHDIIAKAVKRWMAVRQHKHPTVYKTDTSRETATKSVAIQTSARCLIDVDLEDTEANKRAANEIQAIICNKSGEDIITNFHLGDDSDDESDQFDDESDDDREHGEAQENEQDINSGDSDN